MSKKRPSYAARSLKIAEWIKDHVIPPHKTSEALAKEMENDLGFSVSPDRAARALDMAGVLFRRTPADPPRQKRTRTDLLVNRVTLLEARVDAIEKKLGVK